jgi:hypothetical protein
VSSTSASLARPLPPPLHCPRFSFCRKLQGSNAAKPLGFYMSKFIYSCSVLFSAVTRTSMCPSELISWNCGLDLQILFMVQGGITMRKFRRQILSFFIFDSCSLLLFPASPHVVMRKRS